MVLVCLLCKQARSKEEKRKRLMLSAVYTGINIIGMLAINEMGSLLIVLLVYIAFIVIYMQEIKYSIAVIAAGVMIVLFGGHGREMMTDSINQKISEKELISCFYNRKCLPHPDITAAAERLKISGRILWNILMEKARERTGK